MPFGVFFMVNLVFLEKLNLSFHKRTDLLRHELAHGLAAQVEQIHMPGGVPGSAGIPRIMDGRRVEVTIAGIEIKGCQLRRS